MKKSKLEAASKPPPTKDVTNFATESGIGTKECPVNLVSEQFNCIHNKQWFFIISAVYIVVVACGRGYCGIKHTSLLLIFVFKLICMHSFTNSTRFRLSTEDCVLFFYNI